ncbi:MAG: amino acid adenylation domain-containing protein [Cyanobacteria bacterium J06626_6]
MNFNDAFELNKPNNTHPNSERCAVLKDANPIASAFIPFDKDDIEQSVGSRFEQQVAKYPNHIAIKSKTHVLNYIQLNQWANKIARATLAFPSQQPVIIFLEQGAPFIATFLAVLKTGRCAVPVDPTFPSSRNSKIIDDSQASLIITNQANWVEAKTQRPKTCALLNLDELDSTLSVENLPKESEGAISPDAIAYILYTSGSTGNPKGVFQNHRNLLHFIRHQVNSLKVSPGDRTTMLYSCSVNGSLRGTLYTLLNGATLCPFNVKREGLTNLINWLAEEKITIYHSVTTLFRHMNSVLTQANPFPHIRMVILGGEAVSAEDVALYKRIFSSRCLLYTGLGATETGTVREYIVNKQTVVDGSRMPLGYGVKDRDIMLWDEAGREVEPGQVGEICVQSPYLALGYWQNPKKTRAAFLHDPTGGDRRIYRTGDLGKLLPDGCLVHQGRKDFQVKIRGYRVELSEIELALVRHDSVKEVVVVGREDGLGTQRLIAYMVPVSMPNRFSYRQRCEVTLIESPLEDNLESNLELEPIPPTVLISEDIAADSIGIMGITDGFQSGARVSLDMRLPGQETPITVIGQITQRQEPRARIQFEALSERDAEAISQGIDYLCEQAGLFRFSESTLVGNLRSQLKQLLPDYMVPSAFVLLASLPLTANGKVNRKALPEPSADDLLLASPFVKPITPTQKALADIWQQVLGRSQVSIEDNFFELGGHSLLAAQIVARIQTVCQVDLPLSVLFEIPTVAGLAAYVDQSILDPSVSDPSILDPSILDPSVLNPGVARLNGDKSNELLSPVSTTKTAAMPLSFAQQRLWFLQQLDPQSSAYHITRTLRLQGTCQVAALRRALLMILVRHESLRTTFVETEGTLQQHVISPDTFDLQIIDLSNLSDKQQEKALSSRLAKALQHPFNLSCDLMLRASLIRLSEEGHVLQIVMHHIASDGWSMSVFRHELSVLYTAYAHHGTETEKARRLPELPIQYADFARWQRQWLAGKTLKRQLTYWKQQLLDAPLLLVLPTDYPRPAQPSYQGAWLTFHLSSPLTKGLKRLSQQNGATLFMTLLAAFNALLYRYTQQTDIVVGSPIANRNRPELEGLIGFFANTLALRTNLAGKPSFQTLLKRVRQTALGAYAHQNLPFEKLVEELQPTRNLSYSPLFQVFFALQNPPCSPAPMGALKVHSSPIQNETAKFDLTLSMKEVERDGQTALQGIFKYSTDLFATDRIEQMVEHFQRLLEAVVAHPDEAIDTLPMLSVAEQQKLLIDWNDTQTAYPQEQCIHQLFENQVAQTPAAIALVYRGQQLTYQELNCRANRLAHDLRQQGVTAETLVGLCAMRSLDTIVGLLGILKAGGAYVPLDPNYPQERLAQIVDDAQLEIVVTQKQFQRDWKHLKMVLLNGEPNPLRATNPSSLTTPENLAYVLYTSGSNGKPKGVMIEHRSVSNLSSALQQSIEPYTQSEPLTVSLNGSFAFDTSVKQIVQLLHGHTLNIIPEDIRVDGDALLAHLQEHKVNVFDATPSQLNLLLSAGLLKREFPKCVLLGGEPINAATWQALSGAKNVHFYNVYGPTECTVDATIHSLRQAATEPTIGRPIANVTTYILDAQLNPVPVNVPGELHIGGAGVARGYLNRPELTAQKFIANPFGAGRLYKTGDLARYQTDGTIDYLGRIDQQVKLRGFRIELGEIEALLLQQAAIQQAAVIVREDVPGERQLVAYVVAKEIGANELADKQIKQPLKLDSVRLDSVRQALQQQLPQYMLPSAFIVLAELPLTPNGKRDARSLPAPKKDSRTTELTEPRTLTEKLLAQIWCSILRCSKVGIHDTFFELGGHSLLAAQVISRIRLRMVLDVPLRSLFEHPTIAELAEFIDRSIAQPLTGEGAFSKPQIKRALPAIAPRKETTPPPLSFAQQRFWFLQQLEPAGSRYHITWTQQLQGALQVDALRQALRSIVQRHEALRTYFVTVDGVPQQVVHSADAFDLPLIDPLTDLSGATVENPEQTLASLLVQSAREPFNLAADLMLRAVLVRLDEQTHVLQIVIHHIATDGWSMAVFRRELNALYEAYAHQQANPLPGLPIQYGDFAAWQRQWLTGEVLASQLGYWKQQLQGAPALLSLPTDYPRPAQPSYQGARTTFTVSAPLVRSLNRLSQQSNATLFMTLLAAFNTLLYRYSQQDDIVVGSPIANRDRPELEDLIGFFTNTLALRTNLSGQPSFTDLLKRVRQMSLDAYTHQNLPFEKLVEELQPERSLSYSPLFQVLFALQNESQSEQAFSELICYPHPIENETAKFDLTLTLQISKGALKGTFKYNTDLFEASTIERMAGHFQTLLTSIVAHPDQSIAALPMLTSAEQRQLLLAWNDTQTAPWPYQSIQQMFEAQVEQAPEAIALVYQAGDEPEADEAEQLTYRELNIRANQLAHYLQDKGVGPEVLVGLCVPRSLDMIVSLLGILKAGGAYVPLDPVLPQERLDYMLTDSQADIVVTPQTLQASLNDYRSHVDNPVCQTQSDNLAYVLYTSGSTGQPKGVSIEHRQLLNYTQGIVARLNLPRGASFATVSTLAADLGNTVIFAALATGGCLHVISQEKIMQPNSLAAYFNQHKIDCLKIVPSHLAALLTAQQPQQILPRQRLLLGGEACTWSLIEKIQSLVPECVVFNHYGPTETTVGVTTCELAREPWNGLATVPPIGKPLTNSQLYLLDPHRQLVPLGTLGEVYIGGMGLARGYFNRPVLTSEKFIKNPFNETREVSPRLYKTGDLGRRLPDGSIELIGRIDDQIKIRGNRVELGEVESALIAHPQVQQCVVLVREDKLGEKCLVAYIVGDSDPCAQGCRERYREGYRDFLQQTLPMYMVPVAFVAIAALPLTPNGKIDRKALAKLDYAPSKTNKQAYVAPETALERKIANIWADVLQLDNISTQDSFFDLGGHSLLAMHLMSQLQTQLQQPISLSMLFQAPTVKQLALALQKQAPSAEPLSDTPKSLVTLQVGLQRKLPLFFIHPIGGSVMCYQELAHRLGHDQPVYALQSRRLSTEQESPVTDLPPHTQLQAMAQGYIEEIRRVQPAGPYALGGWSMGGVVAFEMAQQLRSQGQQVSSLTLIDSHAPSARRQNKSDEALLMRFAKHLALSETHSLSTLAQLEQLKQALSDQPFSQQLTGLLKGLKQLNILPADFSIEKLRQLFTVFKENFKAVNHYQPKPYAGALSLFTCQEPVSKASQKQSAQTDFWQGLTDEALTVTELAGNHFTILREPSVAVIAKHLKEVAMQPKPSG